MRDSLQQVIPGHRNSSLLAIMCEGELWCPNCSDYDQTDLDQCHVTLITEFDRMCGTPESNWLLDSCCHGCGKEFSR